MYDVIILGSGPSGLTAGIYTSRANLSTLVLGGNKPGGQLMLTTEVENYPGFPDGILGPELMDRMRKQAIRFGAEVKDVEVSKVDFSGKTKKVYVGDELFEGKTIIIATGADTLWLNLPNEQRLIGHGVSSCAPCDGFFFRGKKVIVVGGGDSAMEEALVLTKFASEVTIVHRRDSFKASKIMQDRVLNNPKIKILFNSQIIDVLGADRVSGVTLQSTIDNKQSTLQIDGIFVAVGHTPNTKIFTDSLAVDGKGYVLRGDAALKHSHKHTKSVSETHETLEVDLHPYKSATSIEGVFVAGDVHDHHYKQAITAAGYGCEAALEVEKYIESTV